MDIGYEWYFDKGAVLSVAVFAKYVKNNPQSQTVSGSLSSLISPEMVSAILANYNCTTQPIQCANITNSTVSYSLTSYQNAPGGVLQGVELNYQQQFNFLPAPYNGFGINANYTYVSSKIHYLFRDSASSTLNDHIAPWFGASPNSFNATLYYSADSWEARLTSSYRSKYVDSYPVKTGSADVGYGNSPYINQFVYGKASLYFDTSFSYNINENMSFKLDALNLTNQHTKKYWLFNNTTPRETYDSVSGRQLFMGVTLKY